MSSVGARELQDITMDFKNSSKDEQAKSEISLKSSVSSKFMGKAASKASSECSCVSKSFVGAAAARARASAEAVLTKAAYARRQLDIKREKAKLEAKLEALEIEKEAAAVCAKAEILEAAAAIGNEDMRSVRNSAPSQLAHRRTEEYVQRQALHNTHVLAPSSQAEILPRIKTLIHKTSPLVAMDRSMLDFITPLQNDSRHTNNNACSTHLADDQQRQYIQHPSHYANTPPMMDFARFQARR